MGFKEQLLKDGYNFLNGSKDVLVKIYTDATSVTRNYFKFGKGGITQLRRTVAPNKVIHYIKNPNGQETYKTFRKNSVTIEKYGPDIGFDVKEIFFSPNNKSVQQIYHEWGGKNSGKVVKNYARNELFESRISQQLNYLPLKQNPFNIAKL